jgi:DUF1680 family protein
MGEGESHDRIYYIQLSEKGNLAKKRLKEKPPERKNGASVRIPGTAMKNDVLSCFLVLTVSAAVLAADVLETKTGNETILPVEASNVALNDLFWTPRLKVNRLVTVPLILSMIEDKGLVDNFRIAAGLKQGKRRGRPSDDGEVYKALEAASRSLCLHPDPKLRSKVDDIIRVIAAAQGLDGTLNTAGAIAGKAPHSSGEAKPVRDPGGSGPFFSSGYLYQAAAAHFAATGRRNFLDVAVRNADLLARFVDSGKEPGFPLEGEIEIGLAGLFSATGERKYLDLAKKLLDFREFPEDASAGTPEGRTKGEKSIRNTEHAVRLFTAASNLAALGGSRDREERICRLWEALVSGRLSPVGGFLPGDFGEADPDEAPGMQGVIGSVLWNQNLFLVHGDGKYIDLVERALYNGVASSVSADGSLFFSQAPLESRSGATRVSSFDGNFSPADIARFLPRVPGFIYAAGNGVIFVNLYAAGTANAELAGNKIEIIQKTKYPWVGMVDIGFIPGRPAEFAVAFRLPGWAGNKPAPGGLFRYAKARGAPVSVWVNRKRVEPRIDKGFILIKRRWRKGDIVKISFPMSARRVITRTPAWKAAGRVALEHGPIVYCAEGYDNERSVFDIELPDNAKLQSFFRPDLLGGAGILTGQALKPGQGKAAARLMEKHPFMAVPYGVWGNRGLWEMTVWFFRTSLAESGR